MNEEELAALAEKLYANGLSDADVAMHLDRAVMGQQPEQETTPTEAFATHAWDAIIGPPGLQPDRKNIQDTTLTRKVGEQRAAYDATLDAAEGEHPTASNLGTGAGLLLPLITKGAAGATQGGLNLVRGGGRFVGEGLKSATKRFTTGRVLADAWKNSRTKPPAPQAPAPLPNVEGFEPNIAPPPAVRPKVPDEMEIPTYQRRAKTRTGSAPASQITQDPIAQQMAGPKPRLGQDVHPGKPELGKYAKPAPTQKAGPPVRSQSPANLSQIGDLKKEIEAARAFGMTDEQIAQNALKRGITPEQIRQALEGL